ncbi:pentapeptide repeat-containing protein [Bizionia argentinensis JUB59]|uniref:Pentapeptide repeat-containing protein n=1 Tax=Bizionia argentinensis JUB59 TaxID=1046627 RepID=G2EDU6_9FLAO|nr:pentapeptide repeat-containing protein [Bizionia argentinensis]EGV43369.1 pentapeptide repeat-containing protein [Bizionia argentinensis JUB59]
MENEIIIHERKTFTNVDYTEKILRDREFYKCIFMGCNFTKSDLIGNSFEDCTFENCNFSMTQVKGAGFRNAIFKECKIMGVDFSQCNKFLFSFSFYKCSLEYCTFFGTKLPKTKFDKCSLKETDFSEVNLSASVFYECDLSGTIFSNTVLEKVDFRTASNYAIDPEINKLKKAKFSGFNLEGLLYKYQLDIEYNQ